MPKKGENIYKRKDGRWEARYIKNRNEDGSIHYGYVYARTYREVKQKQIDAQFKIKDSLSNTTDICNKKDFSYWASLWLVKKKTKIKISSYNKYSNLLFKYIIPVLGGKTLDSITTYVIEEFVIQMQSYNSNRTKGLSDKTISDALSVIKNILKYAEKVDCNLCTPKIDISIKHKVPELRILSRDDQTTLMNYLIANPTRKNIGILLCLFTGIRIGELCALQMKDISIEQKYLYIHATMQRIQKSDSADDNNIPKTTVEVLSPKSSCSLRKIPIPDDLIDTLKKCNASDNSYFLTGEVDHFLEPRAMQYHFKRIIKECQLEDINFHALRHTFATRCIELGFDIKTLSELLGHASVSITMNRYVHPSMELKRDNMNRLSALFAVK